MLKSKQPLLRLKNKGFTLIELLVVIAILSVLLVIVLVAINPARQTKAARNTQRKADVLTILNAVGQYFVATGSFPGALDTISTGSAQSIDSGNSTLDGPDFCNDLAPDYVAALPFDPRTGQGYGFTNCGSAFDTGYEITKNTGDRITISAPEAEDTTISVSR
ncbi:MAG: hypothetical protein A2113_00690 [Candidatus Woykebacteria bacterium GWA1_44_8]|uniref:Type II secretion system protein GspG C-terminal domain-containing protein n=1 Tax=Candidatus Woykebacteria bacterium GWA1_44_8 TaxID=1802591 RepID=A0A1G1W2F9_9BACT|nr:MAG: hypothetical protein A2113_00690 [Candidatus Woykebacteria bacterium GWA1_44_8]